MHVANIEPAGDGTRIAGQWETGSCTRDGEDATIVGTLVVSHFGKGTYGARVVPEQGAPWVITYRATPAMRADDGKRVRAHGRPCSKQGEAIVGRHFDADTMLEL